MKSVHRSLLYMLFYLGMLGTAFTQQVQTDFDHHTNFSQYKTYSWQEIKPPNSLWDTRIKKAVDAQLSAKGWTQVNSGSDVAIVAIKTTQTQRTLHTFYDNYGDFGGVGESDTTKQDYKDGTLVVDLFDARTKQLIWRGSAEDMLSNKAEKNEKNLDKGVAKMFKDFPPGSGKR
jgi:Tfp pilus assembly protein PilW